MVVPHVVIVGAGFGGLAAARALGREQVRVTVIDQRNHHTFQPLLYQVATGGLNASDIASPIRRVLRHNRNTEVILGEVKALHTQDKRVELSDGTSIPYDYLVLAAGAKHSHFGHEQWAPRAPGLKSLDDALEIRRRLFYAFEAAEREPDADRRTAYLTFVVVGGGPTGVELAGAVAEIACHALRGDFRHIDPEESRIVLIEGSARVLPTYEARLSHKAARQLEALGVEVRTKTLVSDVDARGVVLGDHRIDANVVLWAAGVEASPLARSLGVPLDRAGRVLVTPDLTIPGHDDVYVIGDMAALSTRGIAVPGVAPAAIQEASCAVKNLLRTIAGKPTKPFQYKNKGSLATIGRASAVADFGAFSLSGFSAWIAWLVVHVVFLVGFRNRILVLFEWAWSYLTFERGARLITGAVPAPIPRETRMAEAEVPIEHPAPISLVVRRSRERRREEAPLRKLWNRPRKAA